MTGLSITRPSIEIVERNEHWSFDVKLGNGVYRRTATFEHKREATKESKRFGDWFDVQADQIETGAQPKRFILGNCMNLFSYQRVYEQLADAPWMN